MKLVPPSIRVRTVFDFQSRGPVLPINWKLPVYANQVPRLAIPETAGPARAALY
jgi:hypothetical protein